MTTGAWPLQTAVYDVLTADATLTGMVSGVYDETPESAAVPYVTIGAILQSPDDGHDRQGLDVELTLHIWSEYRGYRQAATILQEVDRLLDRAPLAVAGFEHVSIAHNQTEFMRDPDPDLRHVVVRYRVWMTEPA